MVVARQSVSAVAHGSGSTATTNAPSGVSAGDLLLLFLGHQASTATPTTPSGWTLAKGHTQDQANCFVWWRIADGSAFDTPSVTLNGTNDWQTYIVRCTGHHDTTPIGDTDSNTGTGTTVAVTPVTVSDAGSLVFVMTQCLLTSDTISSYPSGYSIFVNTALSGRGAFAIGDQAFSPGDTPAGNITYAGGSFNKTNVIVEVVPAAGGGGSGNPWNYYAQAA